MKEKNTIPDPSEININSDSEIPGTTNLQNSDTNETIEKLQIELTNQQDKYLRLFAEFDNFRRRSAKERTELNQIAGKDIIISLLEVLDDIIRAEKQMTNSDDLNSIKEGISLVFNKFRNILQNKGLKGMESIHTPFDVEKHEAISEIPAPSSELKNMVLDEVEKGYYLNDKLIRFAKVIVGK